MAITAGYDLELISAFQIIDCSTSFDLHEIPVPTDITGIEHFQSEEKIIKNRIPGSIPLCMEWSLDGLCEVSKEDWRDLTLP